MTGLARSATLDDRLGVVDVRSAVKSDRGPNPIRSCAAFQSAFRRQHRPRDLPLGLRRHSLACYWIYMLLSRRETLLGLACASLSACTVGPDFEQPEMEFPARFPSSAETASRSRGSQAWWTAFEDDAIDQIVELGLRQNLDVRAALKRIEQARAIAAGAGYPVSGSARVSEGKIADSSDGQTQSAFGRVEATWKLDLFGELRREREAAGYKLDAAYADADVARLVLIEEVITAYVDLRFAQELIRTNLTETKSREKTLEATQNLSGEGGASELETAQAQALLDNTRAQKPEFRILFHTSMNRIIALLGEMPQLPRPSLDRKAPQPVARTNLVQTGVPADLIRNRPDVRKAERDYAEALALAGVAEAQIYPDLFLSGNVQVNYDLLLGTDLPSRFIRAGLDVPLFDLPERNARARAALARAEELLEVWKKKVVNGVEDVQNALFGMKNHEDAVAATERASISQTRVLELAREGYIKGQTDFLQVLDAERAALSAENRLAEDRRNLALDFVNLNVALGGRFS
ncbi:efflux transporter outer membrane subunit [Tropicimonas sp. TH_r6]|uniref:efflux transporter outer membrane subunit n=1 Tax=Tropicimonas sp. TH_r6 TaxID=3082085 RepID=UPI002955CBCF|nr:efflux transporter outer membrane subunit [Tropicimonas sp. TH_r6]MDV7143440.1 efflux transporter outer membrane subunit [Tropicimonas sp. TH_r6]